MSNCIALIRGINVGVGNRVSMADLRGLIAKLGHADVRSLLNSGNVLFKSKRPNVAKISSGIAAAITANCGFSASVMVITAQELDCIIDENPLLRIATELARHLVAFVAHPGHLEPMRPMLEEAWKPDALAITQRAAYLWCATGLLESKMSQAFNRKAGSTITTRNWATVLKIQAAAKDAT
jgi:uncharacterized protein (DUF1697 family)